MNVEKDGIRGGLAVERQAGLAVAGRTDAIPRGLQDLLEHVLEVLLIFHDQYRLRRRSGHRWKDNIGHGIGGCQ